MNYLFLAILSSALISILMRLSADKITNNVSMLVMNYFTCLVISALYAGISSLFPQNEALPQTIGMGTIHGMLYLLSFVLFQRNVKKNGVVFAAIFMKLGLLVPLVVSLLLFRERPTLLQVFGFAIAIGAIVLINLQKTSTSPIAGLSLILLLLAGGSADAMSKVFEEYGQATLSEQFLFYTFLVAFILCVGLMLIKKQRIGKREVFFGCLIGIPNFFSAKFLLKALESVPAVIAYPTYSVATILVVTLTGIILFKEHLSKKQGFAIGAILIALVMLNI